MNKREKRKNSILTMCLAIAQVKREFNPKNVKIGKPNLNIFSFAKDGYIFTQN